MEIYETEEEQVAAIKRWWKENGTSTVTGVVMGIIIIMGWNFWKSYQQDKAHQVSTLYEQLLDEITDENKSSAIPETSARISTQFSSTAYADYADLLLAKINIEQGDLEAAKTLLEKQMNSAESTALRHIARLRLIRLMQASNENEKGLQLIAEADQSSIQGFTGNYDELKGDLYVALERLGEARTAYQSALRAGIRSPLLQFKLDDITASEIVQQVAP